NDALNGVAAALVIVFTGTLFTYLSIDYYAQQYFVGMREEPPSIEDLSYAAKMNLATILLFWLIIYVVKASFLALYWHLFGVSRRFRIVWWITASFLVISFLITTIAPFWHCGSPSNIVNQVMVVPIAMVASRMLILQTPQKLGLCFVFALVLINIAFDIIRTVYAIDPALSSRTNLNAVWTISEPTIAVIVCALPHYRSLLSRKEMGVSEISIQPSFPTIKSPRDTVIPIEMDNMSAYSLHSKVQGNSGG
ncbi:hypothetical protein EJ04DRAFT_592539, partial [Polyplosphaeria fusca]